MQFLKQGQRSFMGSLVLELQRDALNPEISVLVLLRKALVVARKLNIQEFQQWVEKELNGYPGRSYLPQYRFMFGDLKARNPY
ncbi:AbiTii domain-containing protein [Microcoleus sp. D2_18a_D3]|uniref:AbiTii domain-containing protein n=1 Tax=Microcoleus sp. D2_18a_D3 TaxID=3055330 RepID=UPI002FD76855